MELLPAKRPKTLDVRPPVKRLNLQTVAQSGTIAPIDVSARLTGPKSMWVRAIQTPSMRPVESPSRATPSIPNRSSMLR